MVNDISNLKERIRELTELLREWEYKHETKIKELETIHAAERENIIRESEARIEENNIAYEK
jgi:hypothetical protein